MERGPSSIRPVRALPILLHTTVVAATLAVATAHASPKPATRYSTAVTRICAGALLFDHSHEMGTRADAVAVAQDIRASTAGRLARVVAVPVPRKLRAISRRWIASQRRLVALFARNWVRIYDAIDGAQTPEQKAALPHRLHQLVHEPDPLRLVAGRLELKLHVPDCTGD